MSVNGHLTADDRGVIVHCLECHTANRIPFPRLHGVARCGQCKASLPPPGFPVVLETMAVFSSMVQTASIPVFVDFWAPWCGPCKAVAPEVVKLAADAAGELLVAKVDTEDQSEIADSMNIRSIPIFAVFAGGRELDRTSGAMSAPALRAFAQRAVANPRAAT